MGNFLDSYDGNVIRIKPQDDPDSNKGSQSETAASILGDALHTAAYSALQSPLTAVAQTADSALGTDLTESTKFLRSPDEITDTYSTKWHTHQVAAAVGMILPFMLARKGARNILKTEAAVGSGVFWKTAAVKEAALSGFIYEAALHPSTGTHDNLLDLGVDRFKQGLSGAATFGTLSYAGIGIRSGAKNLIGESAPNLTKFFENPITATTLAGAPAGLVSAQSNSILFEGKFADLNTSVESAYAMSFVGASLAAAHQAPTSKNALVPPTHEGPGSKPLAQRLASLKSTAGEKIERSKFFIQEKAAEASRGLDILVSDLAGPQPAFAMAGSPAGIRAFEFDAPVRAKGTKAIKPATTMHMEALDFDGRSSSSGRLSDLEGSLKLPERPELKESRERPPEASAARGESAIDVLRSHSLHDIADFVASNKTLRDLRVDPDRVFHGNDALIVMEVQPSKALPDGAALKAIVPEGGWENNWGKRPGDAKILGKVHEVEMGSSSGTAYVYLQELVEVRDRYEPHLLDGYFRGLEGKNLVFEEPGNNPNKQFGISQRTGKLVLIDYPSTGKPGHMQTLNEIIQGPEYFEREYEAENTRMREGKSEAEAEAEAAELSQTTTRDFERQRFVEEKGLTPAEKEMVDQLSMGITKSELAEYTALMRGQLNADGLPDVKGIMPEINALVKKAKAAGIKFE